MSTYIKRIRSAIDDIPFDINFEVLLDNWFTSVASADESKLPNSQEIATSASASQDMTVYKKPRLPPKVMLQQENDSLKGQLAQEREQSNQRLMELMIRLTKNESKGLREMKQENERQKQEMKEQVASLNARID